MSLPQPTSRDPVREVAVVEPALRAATPAERSWAEIYERLYPRLCRSAARLIGADAASDAVQEGLLRVLTKWPTLAPEQRSDAFVRSVVRAFVIDELRRQERHVEYTDDLEEQGAVPVLPSPDNDGKSAIALIVDELIAKMPPQRRAMCLLVYEEGLTIREAAAALDIAFETARTHMKLAHAWLRNHMPTAPHGYQLGAGRRQLPRGDSAGVLEAEVSND